MMRAEETRVIVALERIADALDLQNALLASGDSPVCPHPAEDREDHSTMGHQRWRCKACDFSVGMGN